MGIYITETMGDSHISTRQHVARKHHECCNCQQSIEKGSEYTKTVGTFDGYFVSNPWHTECYENHVQYIKDQRRKE